MSERITDLIREAKTREDIERIAGTKEFKESRIATFAMYVKLVDMRLDNLEKRVKKLEEVKKYGRRRERR